MSNEPAETGVSDQKLANIYAAMDQLFAESMANRIICMRIWGYFCQLAAEKEGINLDEYVQKQRLESLQSADLWNFPGHRDSDGIKERIKTAINVAFNNLVQHPGRKSMQ